MNPTAAPFIYKPATPSTSAHNSPTRSLPNSDITASPQATPTPTSGHHTAALHPAHNTKPALDPTTSRSTPYLTPPPSPTPVICLPNSNPYETASTTSPTSSPTHSATPDLARQNADIARLRADTARLHTLNGEARRVLAVRRGVLRDLDWRVRRGGRVEFVVREGKGRGKGRSS